MPLQRKTSANVEALSLCNSCLTSDRRKQRSRLAAPALRQVLLRLLLLMRALLRVIMPRILKHRLVPGGILLLGTLHVVVCLRRDSLQPARGRHVLLSLLLLELLLLQFRRYQRAVIESLEAVLIDTEQVEVRTHRRPLRKPGERFSAGIRLIKSQPNAAGARHSALLLSRLLHDLLRVP